MTQKIIKAIYQKPVTYKLIRDGYKTVTNSFTPDDDTPSIMNLSTPSEIYNPNLQYTVDTMVNGAPILDIDSFTSPDNETIEGAQYCYAPKGRDYNYEVWIQEQKTYDNFTAVGSINLDENTGIVTNFSNDNYVQIPNSFNSDNVTEAQVCFITGSDVISTQPFFLSSKNDNTSSFAISSGTLYFVHKEFGSVGDYQSLGLFVSENTKYWFKFTQNNNIITTYLSTDGIQFNQGNSVSRSQNFTTLIGSGVDNDESTAYFTGSLDLSDMYIKINNQTWWTPYTTHGGWRDVQIPGMLDESVTTDNWNQSQNYKLYQLKQQDKSSNLQLTSNNITNEGQKYNQYIDQITIPARDYKWYYHNVSTNLYDNYDIIGSPNINPNTGVISGFSTTNYITITKGFSAALPYKIIVKFTTSSSFPEYARVIAASAPSGQNGYSIIPFYLNYANLGAYGSSNGSSWNMFSHHHIADLSTNTTYTMMFEFTGSAYIWYQKVDGTWIELTRITSNEVTMSPSGFDIGRCDSSISWSGSIDLSEYTIEVNGNTFWSPISTKDKWIANKSIYDYSVTDLYPDTLDFTKSYIGVNNSEYHKYSEPEVCLMPIDGGETTGKYTINCTTVGNIDFDEHTSIVNNFDTSNYLTKEVNLLDNWEIYCKFTTPAITITGGQKIISIGHQTTECKYLLVTLANNGINLYAKTSNDGSSHIIDSGANPYPIQPDTTYYIKIGSNGTLTYFYISETGYDNMTLVISGLPATSIPLTDLYIGSDPYFTAKGAFGGSIDLSETYIKVNNILYWTATTNNIKQNQYLIPKVSVSKILNGNSFGNITLDTDTSIASGFSTTSGITLPETFPSTVSNFDMIFKGKINNFNDDRALLAYADTNEGYVGIINRNSYSFSYWFSGWTEGHTTINLNTYYWFRIIYNGSTTKGYVLLDKGYNLDNLPALSQWSEEWTLSNDKFNSKLLNLGYNFATTSEYWDGSIDLANSIIKIDGSIWWTGIKTILNKYQLNGTEIGTIDFDTSTGIASGFSASDYIKLPNNMFNPGNNPWEIQFKVHYIYSSSRQRMFNSEYDHRGLMFHTEGDHLVYVISGGTSSWDILSNQDVGGFRLQNNTDYTFKLAFTGSAYTVNVSTNNGSFVEILNYQNSSSMSATTYLLGRAEGAFEPFLGTFDLTETYIKSNNQLVWSGVNDISKEYILNATKVGSVNFDKYTSELSNFSDSNYVSLKETFNPGSYPWEVKMNFKTNSDITTKQVLFHSSIGAGDNLDGRFGIVVQISNTYDSKCFGFACSSNTDSWLFDLTGTYIIQPNTTYWIKFGWTGTQYYLDYSLDDTTYVRELYYDSTSFITSSLNYTQLGIYFTSSISNPMLGTIDSSQCEIKINGITWWTGAVLDTSNMKSISGCLYNYNDNGLEQQLDVYYDSNYTQPILVGHGEIYLQGTKVDTITIPGHKLWTYENGGIWIEHEYDPESSGESGVVEESYQPSISPSVVHPELIREESDGEESDSEIPSDQYFSDDNPIIID